MKKTTDASAEKPKNNTEKESKAEPAALRGGGHLAFSYIDDTAMYLFNNGTNYESYRMLGAHRIGEGYRFAVWAPNAKSVSVVCDANGWDRAAGIMHKHINSGIWEGIAEGARPGQFYKYSIEDRNGNIVLKSDPYAFYSEVRPANASVLTDISYTWNDASWLALRDSQPIYDKPLNIYEMHLGSWRTKEDGSYFTYSEMCGELIPYVKKMGYTHIELMPICEYPFDGSWGYQVTGYYSVNSRYGSPKEFKEFVDACHREGIGIILDWVPAHFPRDEHGLAKFDGTPLFEHPDPRKGEHAEWGTLVFNWTRKEIFSFLISNALFWIKEYHIDGLRVDAVSSMLYLDYNRKEGEWTPNKYGGKENLEAIDFLQNLNTAVFERYPNILMIAEESTAWSGVTTPVDDGGLGFNFKWNMGWMHDILDYMQCDPLFRKENHNKLTFPMMYAFSENFILPLSHDEVVHGKRSLIDKMWGSYEEKFAELRLLYAFMYAHPGKKLLFMGGEFGQFIEWRFANQLDWILDKYEMHTRLRNYCACLNNFYRNHPGMYEIERENGDWKGFKWLNADDRCNSVLSFMRISATSDKKSDETAKENSKEKIAVVINFTPVRRNNYVLGVPDMGEFTVVMNSNAKAWGGDGKGSKKCRTKKIPSNGFEYSITLDLPPLTAMYLSFTPSDDNRKNKDIDNDSDNPNLRQNRKTFD